MMTRTPTVSLLSVCSLIIIAITVMPSHNTAAAFRPSFSIRRRLGRALRRNQRPQIMDDSMSSSSTSNALPAVAIAPITPNFNNPPSSFSSSSASTGAATAQAPRQEYTQDILQTATTTDSHTMMASVRLMDLPMKSSQSNINRKSLMTSYLEMELNLGRMAILAAMSFFIGEMVTGMSIWDQLLTVFVMP